MVEQGHGMGLHPAPRALEPDDFEFELHRLTRQHALVHELKRLQVFGRDQIQHLKVEHLLQRLGFYHGQSGRVHLRQAALRVHNLDAFGLVLDDGVQACLALRQADLGLFALGDLGAQMRHHVHRHGVKGA